MVKIKNVFDKFKSFIQQHIVPNIYALILYKRIKRKLYNLENDKKILEIKNDNLDELIKILMQVYERELNRKKIIEDKAKSSLFVISLTISFSLASLGFLESIGFFSNIYILLILIIGIIYLIFSGISCINTLVITGYYDINSKNQIIESGRLLVFNNYNKKEKINYIYRINKLNQLIILIKSNFTYSTFVGIRNGVIFIAVFLITVLINIIIKN